MWHAGWYNGNGFKSVIFYKVTDRWNYLGEKTILFTLMKYPISFCLKKSWLVNLATTLFKCYTNTTTTTNKAWAFKRHEIQVVHCCGIVHASRWSLQWLGSSLNAVKHWGLRRAMGSEMQPRRSTVCQGVPQGVFLKGAPRPVCLSRRLVSLRLQVKFPRPGTPWNALSPRLSGNADPSLGPGPGSQVWPLAWIPVHTVWWLQWDRACPLAPFPTELRLPLHPSGSASVPVDTHTGTRAHTTHTETYFDFCQNTFRIFRKN